MREADENKSELEASQPGNSPFTESDLPNARFIDHTNGGEPTPFPIVGIGDSAEGVKKLQRLFRSFPPDLGIADIVVVHLLPDHPSHLAVILANSTSIPVLQVLGDMAVKSVKMSDDLGVSYVPTKCIYCKGSGRSRSSLRTCLACKGIGIHLVVRDDLDVPYVPKKCIYCKGSGRNRSNLRICIACKEAGRLAS